MKLKSLFIITLLILPFISISQEMNIKMDAVKISFIADKQNTSGTISGFSAKINFNMEDLASSSIGGTVDTKTINTGNDKRDAHLKSADYFESDKYPKISFMSSSFKQDGDNYIMTGMLKIKDKSFLETITFSFANNIFSGKSTIDLSNYSVGDFSTGKKTGVRVKFEIPVM